MVLCKKLKIFLKNQILSDFEDISVTKMISWEIIIGCLEAVESKGSLRGQGFMVVDIGLLQWYCDWN